MDITERKHAEDEMRALIDAIPQLVWIAGPDGSVTYNNQRLIDYTGDDPRTGRRGWMDGGCAS